MPKTLKKDKAWEKKSKEWMDETVSQTMKIVERAAIENVHLAYSYQNKKMGRIHNVSLAPIASCRWRAPCRHDCYAQKAFRMFRGTRLAWARNLRLWKDAPDKFEFELREKLIKHKPRFFRWHVAGDIPDGDYLEMMIRTADEFPNTKFLAFTKQYQTINNCSLLIPDNLSIVMSAWPGLTMENPQEYPVAWMQDGTEQRVPDNALECHGECIACGMCWNLKKINRDVVFEKH